MRAWVALISSALCLACSSGEPERAPASDVARLCEPYQPHASAPLSLEAAREAQLWNALHTRWRTRDHAQPGSLVSETAALLSRSHDASGALCFGDAYVAGRIVFEHAFTPKDGLGHGPAQRAATRMRRVHRGRFGGPDAHRCRDCHWRGGPAGAGALVDNAFFLGDGDSVDSADAHNPPALHGAGVLQALASEMSGHLATLRDVASGQAKATGVEKTVRLRAKGVDFGVLRARADGALDTSGVVGIDADLVVRPFGWKGNHRTLREIVELSFQQHLGIQAEGLVRGGDRALLGQGPKGDPDEDGVERELSDAQTTAVVLYLAAQGLPVMRPPERLHGAAAAAPGLRPPASSNLLDEWLRGRHLFDEVGCAGCHVPSLRLDSPVFETVDLGGVTHRLNLSASMERPRVRFEASEGGYPVFVFSDLRRHDMGEALASKHEHGGVARRMFQTPPLWGLADSGPWMHDGRATSIDEAIRFHGGEGRVARDAYLALPRSDAGALRLFLVSLRREMRWFVP